MIGFEDRRLFRGIGGRLLGAMCIYMFGAALLMALIMMVPFLRTAMPALIAEMESTGGVNQEAMLDAFSQFFFFFSQLYAYGLYIVSSVAAALCALIFLPSLRREAPLRVLYARRGFSWPVWGLALAAMMGLNYVGSLVMLGTEWLFNQFQLSILLPVDAKYPFVYYIYALCVGPVAEELIFRGGVLRALKPYGERFALTASAVCFAFFHGNLNQFPSVLLMGFLLGYLCLRTDSLLMPTLVHMGLNALVSLIRVALEWMPALSLPILALGLLGGLWALKALRARLGSIAPAEPARELRAAFFGAPPMLFYFALCLYSIIRSVSALW